MTGTITWQVGNNPKCFVWGCIYAECSDKVPILRGAYIALLRPRCVVHCCSAAKDWRRSDVIHITMGLLLLRWKHSFCLVTSQLINMRNYWRSKSLANGGVLLDKHKWSQCNVWEGTHHCAEQAVSRASVCLLLASYLSQYWGFCRPVGNVMGSYGSGHDPADGV